MKIIEYTIKDDTESGDDPALLANRRPFLFFPCHNRINIAPLGGNHCDCEDDQFGIYEGMDVVSGELMTYEGWDETNKSSALDLGPKPPTEIRWVTMGRTIPSFTKTKRAAEQAIKKWANQKGIGPVTSSNVVIL